MLGCQDDRVLKDVLAVSLARSMASALLYKKRNDSPYDYSYTTWHMQHLQARLIVGGCGRAETSPSASIG